jgi:hypothetical protein
MVADDSLDSKISQLYGIAPFTALFFIVLTSFSKFFIDIKLYINTFSGKKKVCFMVRVNKEGKKLAKHNKNI